MGNIELGKGYTQIKEPLKKLGGLTLKLGKQTLDGS